MMSESAGWLEMGKGYHIESRMPGDWRIEIDAKKRLGRKESYP